MDADLPARPSTARDQLLAKVMAYVRDNGLTVELSMRKLAAEVGTSHRMLGYHFGSRDELLATVLQALRVEEQADLVATGVTGRRRDALVGLWSWYSSPVNEGRMRSFFYVFGLAAQVPAQYGDFLRSLNNWASLLTNIGIAEGLAPDVAADEALMCTATVRGLLLDLTAGGDRAGANRAFGRLLEQLDSPTRVA